MKMKRERKTNGNRKTKKNLFSSVTCRSRCRGHFGDVKLRCEKQRKTWEIAHEKKMKKKMSVTLTDSEIDIDVTKCLLRIMFLSPVSSTEGVIFNSNLKWLVPLTVEYLCRPSGS